MTKTFFIFLTIIFCCSFDAFAGSNDNAFFSAMCNGSNVISGTAGKVFAAIAIIFFALGFFTGKVSWGLMVGVALAVATIFGGPTIISAITGRSTYDCGSNVGANYDVTANNMTYYYSSCFSASESSTITMTAPAGKVWGGVFFAVYGNQNSCAAGSCGSDVTGVVATKCVGKSTCTVTVSNAAMGRDPCPGWPKKIHVIMSY